MPKSWTSACESIRGWGARGGCHFSFGQFQQANPAAAAQDLRELVAVLVLNGYLRLEEGVADGHNCPIMRMEPSEPPKKRAKTSLLTTITARKSLAN